jgi:EAL domain-containing protein (putative c-di-GMP-specific phosphodiesterase class I)
MTATAEGVETHDQLDRITSEGCTEMQGFLFSRPLPAREIEQWLQFGAKTPQDSDRSAA